MSLETQTQAILAALSTLETKVDALTSSGTTGAPSTPVDLSGVTTQLTALETQLTAVQTAVAAIMAPTPVDLSTVASADALAALDSKVTMVLVDITDPSDVKSA